MKNQTLEFARREINKYFSLMKISDNGESIGLCIDTRLNTFSHLNDSYIIDIKDGKGKITGSNSRSVLLGVYALLRECGCNFIDCTKYGEYIPVLKDKKINVYKKQNFTHRHRVITIEGATSLENVLDIINWAPKVGFNGYFLQFFTSHTFFERWYTHSQNKFLKPEKYTEEKSKKFMKEIIRQIKLRSMFLHSVGHGWTCECIGYPSYGWHKNNSENLDDETRGKLALVDGKRKFFNDIPINTQLCYSNEKVRKKLVDCVVNYAETNQTDYLHFWLGDYFSNYCECKQCSVMTPTDWYIKILNEIDYALTEKKINTKIVFLIYFDLLWMPVKEQLKNKDRFVMMFAPISRTFTKSYYEYAKNPEKIDKIQICEFKLNNCKFPNNIEENLKFLFEWKKIFDGDSFDFDYHLMWDGIRDFSGLKISKIIFEDIRSLKLLGLNGLLSCQLQRMFFPNGFAMYVMARALEETEISFDEIKREYFCKAYGQYSVIAMEILEYIERTFPLEYMRNEIKKNDIRIVKGLESGEEQLKNYLTKLKNINVKDKIINRKIYLLEVLLEFLIDALPAFIKKTECDDAELIRQKYEKAWDFICKKEIKIQQELDVQFFNEIILNFLMSEEKIPFVQ